MKHAILQYDPASGGIRYAGTVEVVDPEEASYSLSIERFDNAAVLLEANDASGDVARARLGSEVVALANGLYVAAVPLLNPLNAADNS